MAHLHCTALRAALPTLRQLAGRVRACSDMGGALPPLPPLLQAVGLLRGPLPGKLAEASSGVINFSKEELCAYAAGDRSEHTPRPAWLTPVAAAARLGAVQGAGLM